ncbi:hypothetical protein MN032_04600 [Agromyces atrinae]|uniref:hypothetical protein n=1 Tax=Agromyces atrinae TaxID=592376 RepID=UPI001F574D74|nr:hypothetical protein [Agromyces atrinae]MCI2956963.1 hypothetical protein [Agromyces atrinae]
MGTSRLRGVTLVVALWSVGFLVGTATHAIDLALGGINVYAGFSPPVRMFWVSLTVLDPLVVALLWRQLRAGIVLAVVIVVCDVGVNTVVFVAHGGLSPFGLVVQVTFGVLVVATAPWLWGRISTLRANPIAPETIVSGQQAGDRDPHQYSPR